MADPCLLLDFGNSCLKARWDDAYAALPDWQVCYHDLPDQGGNPVVQALDLALDLALGQVLDGINTDKVTKDDEVWVSSVLSKSTNQALSERLQAGSWPAPRWAQVGQDDAGVRVGYADPDTLGVDRWLGLLAAYQRFQTAVLVVDAGSAVTVDLLDRTGQHLGGVIAPGLQRMVRGLLQGTDLPGSLHQAIDATFQVQEARPEIGPRNNTAAGIGAGILGAILGLIEKQCALATDRLGQQPQLVLTGGDAALIHSMLSRQMRQKSTLISGLVLDGLQVLRQFSSRTKKGGQMPT